MSNINCVVCVGRLVRDADLQYTKNGTPVSKFSIAVNRKVKKDGQWTEEAHFFNVVLWGKLAEALKPYMLKGKLIGVQGELTQNRWTQNGQNRSRVEIVANNVQLLGGRDSGPNNNVQQSQSTQSIDDFKDDIPF